MVHGGKNLSLPVCSENLNAEVLAYSMNQATLESYIDNLGVGGNTSIDLGVKWGAALLDPTMNPVVNDMISDGDVDAAFAHLPTPYDDDVLKVLVVMSDGENTAQYYLNDDYQDGMTDVVLRGLREWHLPPDLFDQKAVRPTITSNPAAATPTGIHPITALSPLAAATRSA